MTIELFREDSYLKECKATIIEITERGGIVLDKTVFYPTGGGQPGDSGLLTVDDANYIIATTIKDKESGKILHLLAEGQSLPSLNDQCIAKIDWDKRYLHMRMHTALHLLCAAVPCGVTGGQIGAAKSRLDFDIGDNTLDKESITQAVNHYIEQAAPVEFSWIDETALDANPELVRTMSVQPPRGSGSVRLIKVGDKIDLQPCGGTHVKNTSEIGPVLVSKIENKGKRNRRVNIIFDAST